jgi:hypothetical protein
MNITFYKKDSLKSFSIRPSQHHDKKEDHIWLDTQDGEGGQFNADDVADVIYNALEKYFKENH